MCDFSNPPVFSVQRDEGSYSDLAHLLRLIRDAEITDSISRLIYQSNMPNDRIVKPHDNIMQLLQRKSLHEAFSALRREVTQKTPPSIMSLLNSQEETYKYMLHYLAEGYTDAHRDNMLSKIISNLYFVNDYLLREKIIVDSPDIYSSTLRFERVRNASFDSRLSDYLKAASLEALASEAGGNTELFKSADDALASLFAYVWTMFGEPQTSYTRLKDEILNPETGFNFKSQMISALLLGNLAYFDRNAVNCLLDIYESDPDHTLAARTLVALILIFAAHKDLVEEDMELTARLSLWEDSIVTYRQLREVVMGIVKAHDTQRISNKMKNEVLPELMKLRPEILNKLKDISEVSDIEMLDVNPEWEHLLHKSGIGDKLKELTEMQMEGGDVMMMAFSNLKSFPFFNTVSNWFLPFSTRHHELSSDNMLEKSGFATILESPGMMCDSDKYSFAFSLMRMPESQREMLSSKMGEQMEQFKEMMADKNRKSSIPEFDMEVTRYIRDIYRFFKLFRKKNDFPDPFSRPLDFESLPAINPILSDMEILNLVGEFYFKREYYAEALPLLLKIDASGESDPLQWEKIGFCYSALKNIPEAIKWYKKAELLHPDSQWLIKKMAICCRMLNRFTEASEYYEKALAADPENYHLLMSAAHTFLESGDVKKALANYYHADYINPDKPATMRALAWAELINANLDKSRELYLRILDRNDSNATDHLNLAHILFLKKDFKGAIEEYKRSVRHSGFGIEGLEKSIREDKNVLIRLGGNPEELHLLIDKLKYEL